MKESKKKKKYKISLSIFISRGLNKPEVYKLNIDKDLYETFVVFLGEFHKNNHSYENEFIGSVELNNYEMENADIMKSLRNAISTISKVMFEVYDKKVRIKFKHIEKLLRADEYYSLLYIREKMSDWLQTHKKGGMIAC